MEVRLNQATASTLEDTTAPQRIGEQDFEDFDRLWIHRVSYPTID